MKIAIAGIAHETNTYCRDQTALAEFQVVRGASILRAAGRQTSAGGALDAITELGGTPIPLLIATTQPSGTIAADAYRALKGEIVTALADALPVDGVFLDLHGAGVADGVFDLEGDLAEAIRETVGPDVPVTASFDLHGNVTQRMADALDGVFACHQYPHIDMHLRAREAIELIRDRVSGAPRPAIAVRSLPLLLPTTTTFEGIGKQMLESVLAAEDDPDVIDVSWFHGFPYADTPHVGSHIAVTTRGDRQQAERLATQVAQQLWEQREAFRPISIGADEAIAQARAASSRPVVINETSDNCGGGTPGDGTHLLRAMLDANLSRATFGFIVDATVASAAHAAGVGTMIDIELGARYDDLHGSPLALQAYVKALHDGRLVMEAMARGAPLNLGPLARLQVNGIDIVVASRRSQTFDRQPFLAVGIDVREYDFIALKSSNHFRAGFRDIAGTIITADPPGLTTHHIEIFPRENSPKSLWPLQPQCTWQP